MEDKMKEMEKDMQEMKENVEELVEVAKKVTKTAKKVGTEKIKEGAEKGKKAAKKATKKAKEAVEELMDMFDKTEIHTVIQANGMDINYDDVVKKVKDNYRELNDGKDVKVESLNLYIKPEDNAVYYVVNKEHTGKINIME